MNEKVRVEELLENGLISEEQAEKIRQQYNRTVDKEHTKNIVVNVFATIMLALGIIWIVAANWSTIPNAFKLFVGIAMVIVANVWIIRAKKMNKLYECHGLIYYVILLANIALYSQIYQINGSAKAFIGTAIVIALCMSYYLRSYVLQVIMLIMSLWYLVCFDTFFPNVLSKLPYGLDMLISVGLILACVYLFMKENKKILNTKNPFLDMNLFRKNLKSLTTLFIACMLLKFEPDFYGVVYIFIAYSASTIASWTKCKKQKSLYNFFVLLCLFMATFAGAIQKIDYANFGLNHIIYILILIASIYTYVKFERKHDTTKEKAILIGMVTIVYLGYFTGLSAVMPLLTSVMLISYGIALIYVGINKQRIETFYYGEFISIIMIFRYLFEESMGIMTRGITCIVIGIITLVINKYIIKRIKKKKEEIGVTAINEKEDKNE